METVVVARVEMINGAGAQELEAFVQEVCDDLQIEVTAEQEGTSEIYAITTSDISAQLLLEHMQGTDLEEYDIEVIQYL